MAAAMGYRGELTPLQAFDLLKSDREALLVDVRTDQEWQQIGVPDLSSINKGVWRNSWQVAPHMQFNEQFVTEILDRQIAVKTPILFLCRSGVRSASAATALTELGYIKCYNITDGFEGPANPQGHRGQVAGWQASGLPWHKID